MPGPAMKAAVRWLRERGGDAAVAMTAVGGRVIMAQGERGPFTPATVRKLCEAGLAEYYDHGGRLKGRLRLTASGKALD